MNNRFVPLFALALLSGCPGGGTTTTDDMAKATPADMAMAPPADMAMPMPMGDMAMPMPMGDMAMMDNTAACMTYCNAIMTNCASTDAGVFTQYADVAACNKACLKQYGWPVGMPGATDGNTLACRAYHTEAAKMNAATHCPHAGPSGGNVCGKWCDVYCDLAMRNCTGNLALYTDRANCMTSCGAFATSGKPNDTSGNTIQCRIYHLGVAGTDAASAMTHCPHGLTNSAVCK